MGLYPDTQPEQMTIEFKQVFGERISRPDDQIFLFIQFILIFFPRPIPNTNSKLI